MDRISELTQEKSTWLFLAEGLTQEHQQSVRRELLMKAENIQEQINELKKETVCNYISDGYRPPCYMNKLLKCENCRFYKKCST